jgi:hypothetical protein
MAPQSAAAWRDLEARFARALTVWGFTRDEAEAAPYARAVVRSLKADGWRTPLPEGYRVPGRPRWDQRARPDQVRVHIARARAQIRKARTAADA